MDPDPWKWSVQDVQRFFRDEAANYIADLPHSRLPPLDRFLTALDAGEVDGATLLTIIDSPSLRDDCGVASLGARSAVMHCIVKLRRSSSVCNTQHRLQGPPITPSTPSEALPSSTKTTRQQTPPTSTQPPREHIRDAEVEVQDASGRKRRKLDLRKTLEHQPRTKDLLVPLSSGVRGYLGDAALPIDSLFYGNTPFGQEIRDFDSPSDIQVLQRDQQAGLGDDNFQFTHQHEHIGESRFVYSKIFHLLSKDNVYTDNGIAVTRQGRKSIAYLPYRAKDVNKDRSVTVLQFRNNNDEPVAVRERAADIDRELDNYESRESEDDLNALNQKYATTGDTIVPFLGESEDDDDEDSDDASNLEEHSEASETDEADDNGIASDAVAAAIEAFIQERIEKWKDAKMPDLEQTRAWTIWKQMKQSRTLREVLIQSAHTKIVHFTSRIDQMRGDFPKDSWENETAIHKLCVAMEPTIDDRELERWKITVWQRRQEPVHNVRPITHKKKHGQHAAAPNIEQGIQIHPDDRFSVSPAPMPNSVPDNDLQEEIQYDADDEVHVTREQSPASPGLDNFVVHEPEDRILRLGAWEKKSSQDDEMLGNGRLPLDAPVTSVSGETDPAFVGGENESESEDLPDSSTFVRGRVATPLIQPVDLIITSSSEGPIPANRGRFRKTPQQPKHTAVGPDTSSPKKVGRPRKIPQEPSEPMMDPAFATPKKRGRPQKIPQEPTGLIGDAKDAKASDVETWTWQMLIEKNDRLRMLIKLLFDARAEFRSELASRRALLKNDAFLTQLQLAVRSCREHRTDMQLQQEYGDIIGKTARIYTRWSVPTLTEPEVLALTERAWSSMLHPSQFQLFDHMLASILTKNDSKLFNHPNVKLSKSGFSAAEPIDVSSDVEEAAFSHLTPHKTRKKEVKRSAAAMDSRTSALNRQKRYEESKTSDSAQLVRMLEIDQNYSDVVINPSKREEDDPIYISDHIARSMKEHQLEGIQFLWREITADGEEGGQGCILAHTMGLGKTMQTIAVLGVLNQALHSQKPGVIRQLPRHLQKTAKRKRDRRDVRTLVLCPPGLILNWRQEIEKWANGQLGRIASIESGSKRHLMDTLEKWKLFGGVLLIGYQQFRKLLTNKKVTAQQSDSEAQQPESEAPQPDPKAEEIAELEKYLLRDPDIVVADEAHYVKSSKAIITDLASRFKTESRIALTGTPMSNNLDEIYALASWVAPGFLGDPTEFKAHYAEPIKQGLFIDSTAYEKRRSLMKLKVLQADIEPKVNRANIEALRGSLKQKTEFVITIPLVETQLDLYKKYIKALRTGNRSEDASQVTIFAWLNVLTLLANHPHLFRQKLLAPPPAKKMKAKPVDNDDDVSSRDETPGVGTDSGSVTPALPGAGPPAENVKAIVEPPTEADTDDGDGEVPDLNSSEIEEVLEGYEDSLDPELSAKMTIMLKLLELSLACGDKVLIFSSSIPTLDFLAELLEGQGKAFGRIQGSVKADKRMEALEDFKADKFSIMLLSTKAAGVGLNIMNANRVFIMDFKFNPADEEQAIGRAYRLGQEKPVYVYRFITGGCYAKNLYDQQLFKSSLTQRVVDKKNPRRNAERNARDYLYEPKVVPQEGLTEWMGKDPMVLDRYLQQHSPNEDGGHDTMIRAIRTMETLQEDAMDAPLDDAEQKMVNEEIALNRQRPRGKRAAAMEAMSALAPPPTAPHLNRGNGMGSLPASAGFLERLQSTAPVAGAASASNSAQLHPLGGLPSMPSSQAQ